MASQRRRSAARTSVTIGLAATLLAASAIVGIRQPASASHGLLQVVSSTDWIDSGGDLHIVGDVLNATGGRLTSAFVRIRYFDADGQVVGNAREFVAFLHLSPHSTNSFHHVESPVPEGYDHYELEADSSYAFVIAYRPLVPTMGTPFTDGSGAWHVPGEVTSFSDYGRSDPVTVSVTLYAGDQILNAGQATPNPAEIPGGGTATFGVAFADHFEGATSIRLQADTLTQTGNWLTSWDNFWADLYATTFREDIIWISERGITLGCGGDFYCPTEGLIRAHAASFLARAFALPATSIDFFRDDERSPREADINRLAAAGISLGCGSRKFCPDRLVTRAEMATFLARALALPPTDTDFFTDDEGNQHEDNINRAAAAGIANGCTSTTYCPLVVVTREEIAGFLRRALD